MDSRDLRNLAEAWERITTPENEQLDERISPQASAAAARQRRDDAAAVNAAELKAGGGQTAVDNALKARYGGRMPSQRQLARHSSGASATRSVTATGRENLYRGGGGDAAVAKGLTRQQVMAQGVKNMEAKPTAAAPAPAPRPAAPAGAPKDVIVKAAKGGVPGTLNKTTGKWTASASGDTKPTTPTGATVADKKTAVPTKTQNPLMKDNSVSDMIKASQMRQKGANVTSDNIASVRQSVQQANRPEVQNRPAPAGSALRAQQDAAKPGAAPVAAKPAPTPAAKPAPVAAKPAPVAAKPAPVAAKPEKRTPTQIRQGINAGVDLFDIVKGHLLDEGYADTEEAALAIMANMSEEWKQTILEADSVANMAERAAKRRQQRYGKQGGGGRDDYRPYTEDDYKNPKPGYGSSQVKPA